MEAQRREVGEGTHAAALGQAQAGDLRQGRRPAGERSGVERIVGDHHPLEPGEVAELRQRPGEAGFHQVEVLQLLEPEHFGRELIAALERP